MLRVVVLVALALGASGDEGLLTEQRAEAQIDWSQRTVRATGRGAPPNRGLAAAVAPWRLAEANARAAAQRRVLAALGTMRAYGTVSVAALLEARPGSVGELEAALRALEAVDTKYYSDGGVDLVLAGSFDGAVLAAVVPEAGKAEGASASDEPATGVIVNARGVTVVPALAPRLLDEKGAVLFDARSLSADGLERHGAAAYYRSVDRALRDPRVGGKPVIVKAVRPAERGSADLVIPEADAERLRRLAAVLADGRVTIVVD